MSKLVYVAFVAQIFQICAYQPDNLLNLDLKW